MKPNKFISIFLISLLILCSVNAQNYSSSSNPLKGNLVDKIINHNSCESCTQNIVPIDFGFGKVTEREVNVKSLDEAKALLAKNTPDYTFKESFNGPVSNSINQLNKEEFVIHYTDEIGNVAGHGIDNIHGTTSHINLLDKNGKKINILIDDLAK